MGSGSIPTRADLDTMNSAWWNSFQAVIAGDLVPRDSSAVATDLAASFGTAAFRWKRMQVKTGHFSPGDIKYRNSYNGLTSPGAGWMLCDGREINEENYDLEHGAGAWSEQIGTSTIEDKFLPNLIARYSYGVSATTQDGTIAITPVGNTSHIINIEHNHNWYNSNGAGASDTVYDSSGNATTLTQTATHNTSFYYMGYSGGTGQRTMCTAYTNNQMSTTQSIQPQSIEAQPYMRII